MSIKEYLKLQFTPKMLLINILEILGFFSALVLASYIFTIIKMMVLFK